MNSGRKIRWANPFVLKWLACVCLVVCPLHSAAQHQRLRFERVGIEQGLSQSSVNALLQDREGFLWVATDEALNLYDGYQFTVFNSGNGNHQLSDSLILSLHEDTRGRLWVGTFVGGLNRFDKATRQFKAYRHRRDAPGTISHNKVNALAGAPNSKIWVGTENGLDLFDPETEQFESIPEIRNEPVQCLLPVENGALWIGTSAGLIYRDADGKLQRFVHEPDNPKSLSGNQVDCVYADGKGNLWVGTRSGLNRIAVDHSITRFEHDEDRPDSLASNWVRSVVLDKDGVLWVATNAGLDIFDGDRFIHHTHDPGRDNSLSSDHVTVLQVDRGGVLWVGTTARGLNKFHWSHVTFSHFRHDNENENSLGGNNVKSIYQRRESIVWIGTHGNGFDRLDRTNNHFTHFMPPKLPGRDSHGRVWALLEDEHDLLWVGTNGNGLYRYDEQKNSWLNFCPIEGDPQSISHDKVRAIFQDNEMRIWVGTKAGGLNLLDRDTGSFTRFLHNPDDESSLSSDWVRCITQGRNGMLWVGTKEGLNRFNPQRGKVTRYNRLPNEDNSLSHNVITTICEDERGFIWVGTYGGGLNELDPDSGQVSRYRDLIPHGVIYGILIDEEGYLWLSTNKGLTRFHPLNGNVKHYDVHDGLQSNEFNIGAWHKGVKGAMFFGGINGFNLFYPKHLLENQHRPNVVFTAFKKQNLPFPLPNHISQTEAITLNYDDRIFSFEFAALDYLDPNSNKYQYMLEGFQNTWVPLGSRREMTFTNLDPGNYVFRVKGSNNDGLYSETGASMRIRIIPPIWRTTWAYLLYTVLLVGAVLAYVSNNRRKLAFERSVNERLVQLDRLKDEFLANTSHELRTPLNGIIGLAESLVDGATGELSERTRANLKMIVSSGRRLGSLVNDLLDFSKLKSHSLELTRDTIDLHACVEMVVALTKPLLGAKDVALLNEVDPELPPLDADENRLLQILHNLLGNSVKFTEQGQITISAEHEGRWITVAVADSGMGIPEEKIPRIFESFEQVDGSISRHHGGTGLGLTISRKLVELHGGEIWVESEEGEGTTVYFTMPISTGALLRELHSQLSEPPLSMTPDLPQAILESQAREDEGTFKVLVVDDEPVNRQVVFNNLSLGPYRVQEAADGHEALALLDDVRFDLILLDIMMPRLNGFETCRRIRQRWPMQELPIIFLTAKGQDQDKVAAFMAGGNDYLVKPVAREELLARVRTHLGLLDATRTLEARVAERTEILEVRNDELALRNRELGEHNLELQTLNDIARTIHRQMGLEPVLQCMLEQGIRLFPGVSKGVVIFKDKGTRDYRFRVTSGYKLEHLASLSFERQDLEARYGDQHNTLVEGVFLCKTEAMPEVASLPKPASRLAMSIVINDDLYGFLVLDSFSGENTFDEADVQRLVRFRQHALSAVANALLLSQLRHKNEQVQAGLRYAERIQKAILPEPQSLIELSLPSFVIYQPQAIVSGDFFWWASLSKGVLIAVADCTGHGIPGALMSMIGTTLLDQFVREERDPSPANLLKRLNEVLCRNMGQERERHLDGMDIAICMVSTDHRTITFAGARRAMWLVKESRELVEVRGDRYSLGDQRRYNKYQEHHYELDGPTWLYLFTDGVTDLPDSRGNKYSHRRLRTFFREHFHLDAQSQSEAMQADLKAHGECADQRDDLTLMGVHLIPGK